MLTSLRLRNGSHSSVSWLLAAEGLRRRAISVGVRDLRRKRKDKIEIKFTICQTKHTSVLVKYVSLIMYSLNLCTHKRSWPAEYRGVFWMMTQFEHPLSKFWLRLCMCAHTNNIPFFVLLYLSFCPVLIHTKSTTSF